MPRITARADRADIDPDQALTAQEHPGGPQRTHREYGLNAALNLRHWTHPPAN